MSNKDLIAGILSLGMLAGAAAEHIAVRPSGNPAPYHIHLHEIAATMPMRCGDWVAKDVPAADVKAALHANVMIDRQWTNSVTGQSVGFLFTQCPDVRDLVPHYPPVCYPGRGLTQVQTTRRTWEFDKLKVEGTEYTFESNDFSQNRNVTVENFMLIPGGGIVPDMKEVKSLIPLKNRYYGAGQVQIVFNDGMRASERDEIFHLLVNAHRPLIDAILAGKVR